jgi:hypothetical protein
MGQQASSTLATCLYLSIMPAIRSSKKVEAEVEEEFEEEVKTPKKKMTTAEKEEPKKEMSAEEKAAVVADKKAAAERAAEERKVQLADAIESITKAGVPRKVSSAISAVWLDDTKTYVTAALLGRPIETSIKSVNRLKKVPDEKRIERLANLYSRVAGLEEKLIRARLEVVHIEHARIVMAYPETVVQKRKLPTGFVAGETTRVVDDDDDCGCNDSDLEEEVAPRKRKAVEKKAPKAAGEEEPAKKKKKVAKAEADE